MAENEGILEKIHAYCLFEMLLNVPRKTIISISTRQSGKVSDSVAK